VISSCIDALEKGPRTTLDAVSRMLIRTKDPHLIFPLLALKTRLKGSDYGGARVTNGVPLDYREKVIQAILVELAQAEPGPFLQTVEQEGHPLRWAAIHVLAEARIQGLFDFFREQILERPGQHKALLLNALSSQEHPERIPFLGALLQDRDEAVVSHVIFILREAQDTRALPYVRRALRDLEGDPRMIRLLLLRLEKELESLSRTKARPHLRLLEGPGR